MAVQYDKETNSIITWIDRIKNGLNGISSQAIKTFESLNSLNNEDLKYLEKNGFDEFIKNNKLAEKSLVDFLGNNDYAQKNLETYQQYLKDTSKQTSIFSSVTTQAKTVIKTFGAILASASVNLAIVKGIELIAKGIDSLTNASKKAQEKVQKLTDECGSLKTEIDSLRERNELTSAEQQRISYLETQLALQQQLLDIESRRLAQSRTRGSGFLGLSQAKSFTESGSYADLYYQDHWIPGLFNSNSANNLSSNFETQMNLAEAWLDRFDESGLNGEDLKNIQNGYDNALEKVTNYYASAIEKASEYKSAIVQIQSDIESGILIEGTTEYNDSLEYLNEFTSAYELMINMIGRYESHTGNGNTILNSMQSDIENFDTIKEKLSKVAESGKLTEEYLNTHGYKEILDYLNNGNVSIAQFCDYLTSAEDTVQEISEVLDNTDVSFTFDNHEESIDNIQSALSSLRSALESLNKGELSENAVLDLMQQFPDLVPYIDLTADGFGSLSEGLSKLIEQQPNELIEELKQLKDSLSTEEEREQVELLIDSLQRLSSYGDSGAEAYTNTIGNTWNGTAAVIEGVTTQFENLAKVQEAVADGLTLSATAAAELAKMYPEILDHAQVTANGQIALNEDVVNSILDGDQSIVDGQIAKLEADKALLIGKKSYAEAQLDIVKQVGEGEGHITKEVAQYRLNTANSLLEALVKVGLEEDTAYAAVAANMAGNMDEFNRIVGTVAQDMATNMDNAAVSMANSIHINSINSQTSFDNLQKKIWDLANSVKFAAKGERSGNSGIYGGGGSTSGKGIKKELNSGGFNTTTSNYTLQKIDLDDFQSQLELDIKGYADAISNIDAQIEVLKNLQTTFDTNGGAGGHGYADKIKQLEAEKDTLNNAAKDSAGSAGDPFQKAIDFFKQRVEVLTNAFELLEKGMNNVFGADAKNTLLSTQIGILDEEVSNYTDALAMYRQKANEALSGLDSDLQDKIVNGAVQIADFIGDGNEAVVEAMEAYQGWADEVNGCTQKLEELKTQIRQLELDKFNNIADDFTDQFDIRDDSIDLIKKQIGLLEEAGNQIGESFYSKQIEQSQKQLNILETEKARLTQQLNDAITSGRVQHGTEEWLEMQNALTSVEGKLLDCKTAIEGFDNELLELNWNVFDRVQTEFGNIGSELDNLAGLFDDFNDIRVSDGKGTWTDQAIATLGLYAQQYELAQYQVEQYGDAIDKLNEDYLAGKYSSTEYMDKLAELSGEQWNAVDSAKSLEDAIYKLNETRVNEEIKTIEDEISAYKESTDARIEALNAAKDLHDYEQSIAEKSKSIANLERQIAAMQNDTSASTIAKRKKLEEELAKSKQDLADYEYDHSVKTQQDALNKNYEAFEAERNKEIEALESTLENKELLISNSLNTVKANTAIIGEQIALIAQQHGIIVSDAVISPWITGANAIAGYGEVLSAGSSAFIAAIIGVQSYVYGLQEQANVTAESMSYMFGTRADNLVNELVSSYYSEENLNAMTNILQNSLVNMLERGYNVNSVVSALSSIASGADSVAAAANNAADALAKMGAVQAQPSSVQQQNTSAQGQKVFAQHSGSQVKNIQTVSQNKFVKSYQDKINKTFSSTRPALVSRYTKGGIIKEDRNNPYNELAQSVGEDTAVFAKLGEAVLTPEQTRAMMNLAPILESMQKTWDVTSIGEPYKMPEFTKTGSPNVTLHIDKLNEFNGDFNGTEQLIGTMQKVAAGTTNKILGEINRNFRRGM